jgi:predicted permease
VRSLDLGYDPDPLIFVNLEMRGTELDSAGRTGLRERLVERAEALPGVVGVGRTMAVPFYMTWSEDVIVPGMDTTELRGQWFINAVSPGYFEATGTRLLRGRGIEPHDGSGSQQVVVVSEAAAKAIWKDADPIGRCVKTGSDTTPCMTVVGVAENIRRSFAEDGDRHLYMSVAQRGGGGGSLFVRTDGDARGRVETVRRGLQKLMPGTAYVEARSLREIVDPNIRSWRMGATMFTLFGGLALLVAAVGLYSVIAYGVAQRTHELGVRIALGARARDVVRMVVGEGTRVAIVGVALGMAGALLAARWVAPLLYEVSARDPMIYAGVAAVLLVVAVTASLVPALRASRVDPNVALRSD